MKVTIDIFHWQQGELPRVLHSMTHDCHSLDAVATAVQAVIEAPELPVKPHGYRITTEQGVEFYGWPTGRIEASHKNPASLPKINRRDLGVKATRLEKKRYPYLGAAASGVASEQSAKHLKRWVLAE
jgi:hypothetical protein